MYTVCKLSADSENGNNFIMFFYKAEDQVCWVNVSK